MDSGIVVIAVVLNGLLIFGGILVILMAMHQRSKEREMQHRERLAMIERGLAPGPERDPHAFEAWQQRQPPARATSIGVVIVGLGIGLMLIIGVAAATPDVGVGVGGAIVVVGLAFIVNGQLQRRPAQAPSAPHNYPAPPRAPQAPPDPPGPVGS